MSYSMTSSARPSSGSGDARPSAPAVLRLMTSSTFVGCCTGSAAGRAPLGSGRRRTRSCSIRRRRWRRSSSALRPRRNRACDRPRASADRRPSARCGAAGRSGRDRPRSAAHPFSRRDRREGRFKLGPRGRIEQIDAQAERGPAGLHVARLRDAPRVVR